MLVFCFKNGIFNIPNGTMEKLALHHRASVFIEFYGNISAILVSHNGEIENCDFVISSYICMFWRIFKCDSEEY